MIGRIGRRTWLRAFVGLLACIAIGVIAVGATVIYPALAYAVEPGFATAVIADIYEGIDNQVLDYTVVFEPGGATGYMPEQHFDCGAVEPEPEKLAACTFAREGYTFDGWAVSVPSGKSRFQATTIGNVVVADEQELVNLTWESSEWKQAGWNSVVDLGSYADDDRVITLTALWHPAESDEQERQEAFASRPHLLSTMSSSTTPVAIRRYTNSTYWYLRASGDSATPPSGFNLVDSTMYFAPSYSDEPVYRMRYRTDSKRFHYCMAAEHDALIRKGKWDTEGIAFYSDDACGLPVYRYLNGSMHIWSLSGSHTDYGTLEGIGMYGLKWYNISFDGNGATSGSMEDMRCQWGIAYSLTANAFVREGYTFSGWRDPNGTIYTDARSVSDLTDVSEGTVTLTALWDIVTYSVSYNANGGVSPPESQVKEYGNTLVLSDLRPSRSSETLPGYSIAFDTGSNAIPIDTVVAEVRVSYDFDSWNTDVTGSGQRYAPGDEYRDNESVTLYAQWKTIYEVEQVSLPETTRSGYEFAGWYRDSGFTDFIGNAGEDYRAEGSGTLYARWFKMAELPMSGQSPLYPAVLAGVFLAVAVVFGAARLRNRA